MQEYLVLHADTSFLAAIFYTADNKWIPITKKGEDFLWLFFYSDPHEDKISFGKIYERHYLNNETNYYGDIFKIISDEKTKFTIRSHNLPAIELLKESGLLDYLKNTFYSKSGISDQDVIPTLISFSHNITDASKEVFLDFLANNHFRIDSFSIPLSELIIHYYWKANKIEAQTGNEVVLLNAINSDLSINLLCLCDGYFLQDDVKKNIWQGRGSDPRKYALIQYVVDCVNKSTGILATEKERIAEYHRQEQYAEEWLKRLDLSGNALLHIPSINFALAPSITREVFVKKSVIESDTGRFVQELLDIYREFENDFVSDTENICAVIFFGDSLKNDLVKKRFQTRITEEKIHLFSTREIYSVLSIFPQIDIHRYVDEADRLKALASAEIQKQREKDKQYLAEQESERKEKEIEEQNKNEEQKKLEADKLIVKAGVLTKDKMFTEALILLNQALEIKPNDNNIKNQITEITSILAKINARLQLYKEIISTADQLFEQKIYDQALIEYSAAKKLSNDKYPQQQIDRIKVFIVEQKQREKDFQDHAEKANELEEEKKYSEAEKEFEAALEIKPDNEEIKLKLIEVRAYIKKNIEVFERYKKDAALAFEQGEIDKARFLYEQALENIPQDKECLNQLTKIVKRENEITKNKEQYNSLLMSAENYYNREEWKKAKVEFEKVVKIFPEEVFPIDKIKKIDEKLAEAEATYKDLFFEANTLLQQGKQKDALELFKKAQAIDSDNIEVNEKIKKIEFHISFSTKDSPAPTKEKGNESFFSKDKTTKTTSNNNKLIDDDDDFFDKKKPTFVEPFLPEKKKEGKINDDDFLNIHSKKPKQGDDIIQKKNDKKEDDDWDFFKK